MTEINYDQAASILQCSPRNVRRLLKRNGVKPIVRGHRTVRFPLDKIQNLQATIILSHSNGKTRK